MTPEKKLTLKIEEIRQLAAFLPRAHHTQRESHPFTLLPGGFPKGALLEISARQGSGKTELILQFLIENPALKVAWIEKEFSLYPYALGTASALPGHHSCSEAGLHRMLFVETANRDPLAIAHQILRSQVFALVVLSDMTCTELALRRLQLSAQKSGSSVALLVAQPTTERNWPIALQLKVSREKGELKLTTLRGRPG